MKGTGEQLKKVLEFLWKEYPEIYIAGDIKKALPEINEDILLRLLSYAYDSGWVTITGQRTDLDVGPYRLTSAGIDKLNNWEAIDNKRPI